MIGTPPKTASQWLGEFAKTNEVAAHDTLNPFKRVKYRGQAWAFRVARDLVAKDSRPPLQQRKDEPGTLREVLAKKQCECGRWVLWLD